MTHSIAIGVHVWFRPTPASNYCLDFIFGE